MEQSRENILQNLKDAGLSKVQASECMKFIDGQDYDGAEKYLRCIRCGLMDELHESQSKVDSMDFMLYNLKKQKKQEEY